MHSTEDEVLTLVLLEEVLAALDAEDQRILTGLVEGRTAQELGLQSDYAVVRLIHKVACVIGATRRCEGTCGQVRLASDFAWLQWASLQDVRPEVPKHSARVCLRCESKDTRFRRWRLERREFGAEVTRPATSPRRRRAADRKEKPTARSHEKERRSWPHGTIERFRQGCTCTECHEARRAYGRFLYRVSIGRPPRAAVATHGSNAKYRRGCRCDACKAAHQKAGADYRARRRAEHGQ